MKDKAYNQLMSLLCIAIGTAFVTCCLFFYFFDGCVMMNDSCVKLMMVIALVLIGAAVILLLVVAGCAIYGKIDGNQEAYCITAQLGQDAKIILVRKETQDKIILFRCKDLQNAVEKITSKDEIHICEKKVRLNKQTLQCLKSKIDSLEEVTICFENFDCSGTICCEVEAQPTNSAAAE